jgi:hypothetical protein
VSPVRYELGFYIPEDCILRSHRRESLKSYKLKSLCERGNEPSGPITCWETTEWLQN